MTPSTPPFRDYKTFTRALAAKALAPAESKYNLLYFYGNAEAIGKLLKEIAGEYVRRHSSKGVVSVSARQFTFELADAIRHGTQEAFRLKYRDCNLLLLDQLQDAEGKPATMEELYTVIDRLRFRNVRLVFGADRPPRDILALDDRLRAYLESGLLCNIDEE